MALSLKKARLEADFLAALRFESFKVKADPAHWHSHIGGLIFDRYMFGSGASDFFDYGYLVMENDECVGFLSVEASQNSAAIDISLSDDKKEYYRDIILSVLNALGKGKRVRINANIRDKKLLDALDSLRFIKGNESRAQYVFDLKNTDTPLPVWEKESIAKLTLDDLEERVYHSALATSQRISSKMYKALMDSPYYKNAVDLVVRNNESGQMAGYIGFWFDENSLTALVEPAASIKEFRRRGIMKRALLHGIFLMRQKGLDFIYVSTEGDNTPARKLYESVGFKRYGRVFEYYINL
ncbi:MAG: GNAT family N-acetyltransferase [Clostridia bacterium]|nr:GNAT family N-acetyltransferase [Clostridia bacterium]